MKTSSVWTDQLQPPALQDFDGALRHYNLARQLTLEAFEKARPKEIPELMSRAERIYAIECLLARVGYELFCLRKIDAKGDHATTICCASCLRTSVQIAVSMVPGLLPDDYPFTWEEFYAGYGHMDTNVLKTLYRTLPHDPPEDTPNLKEARKSLENLRSGLGPDHPLTQLAQQFYDAPAES